MVKSSVLGVIPARLDSIRLPRKPLRPILGRPLLEWVWRRVSAMTVFDRVVVATDAPEIRELCRELGAPCLMTSLDHPSGSDRVAEVAEQEAFRKFEVIVNVQGDEPLVQEDHLARCIELVRDEGWDVGTCATPVDHLAAWEDPSVVKVARAVTGRALYFSRAPIPFSRDALPTTESLQSGSFLRHVGVYVYRRKALLRWVGLEPSPLERLERLEQLRALEDGMQIGVAVVQGAHPGVDTEHDVSRMEELLSESTRNSSRTQSPLTSSESI